jgi:PST family polysaccharide transporter
MLRRLTQHAVARNALALYAIKLAEYGLPFITVPYVARVLGIEKLGLIMWAQSFIGYFVVITEYGFNFTATRQIAIHRDDLDRVCRIYSAAMAARVLLTLVCLAIMTVVVFSVPVMRPNWALFYISFLTVVGTTLFPQWLFQGLERMGFITIREVGARFIGLMTIFFLVRSSDDYLWAAAIMSGSTAIAGLIGLIYVRRMTGVHFCATSFADVRAALIDGWHVFLSTAAITIYGRSNTFILGFIASDADVGAYASALKPIEALKTLVFPLSTAIFPHVSRLSADSKEEAIRFIKKTSRRLLGLFALVSLAVLVTAPISIRILYGRKFAASVPLMQIMAPIPFLVAGSACFGTYYMLGLGYKKEWSRMIITAGFFNFVVLVPLLFITPPANAISITGTTVEAFVLMWSYLFYRMKQR